MTKTIKSDLLITSYTIKGGAQNDFSPSCNLVIEKGDEEDEVIRIVANSPDKVDSITVKDFAIDNLIKALTEIKKNIRLLNK